MNVGSVLRPLGQVVRLRLIVGRYERTVCLLLLPLPSTVFHLQMNGLKIEDFDLTEKVAEKDWIVEYEKFKSACLEIEHKKEYTACLFFIRPKYGIPLHDHPGMNGAM